MGVEIHEFLPGFVCRHCNHQHFRQDGSAEEIWIFYMFHLYKLKIKTKIAKKEGPEGLNQKKARAWDKLGRTSEKV